MLLRKGKTEVIKALFDGGADLSFLKPKRSFFDFFSSSSESYKSGNQDDMEKLIKEITDPKEIKIRNQNLNQIKFNKENDKLFDSIYRDSRNTSQTALAPSLNPNPSPTNTSEITLADHQGPTQDTFYKEVSNCLLFLKFAVSQFSSAKKSNLSKDDRETSMLEIYKKNNPTHDDSFIKGLIVRVTSDKNLQNFLNDTTPEDLIKLSMKNISKESLTESGKNFVKEKIDKIFSEESSKNTPTTSPTGTSTETTRGYFRSLASFLARSREVQNKR
jgi:hypothetical protein